MTNETKDDFPHAGFHVLGEGQGKLELPCGCGLYRPTANEVSFRYCSTHAAAAELLEALENIVAQMDADERELERFSVLLEETRESARAAIAKARGIAGVGYTEAF